MKRLVPALNNRQSGSHESSEKRTPSASANWGLKTNEIARSACWCTLRKRETDTRRHAIRSALERLVQLSDTLYFGIWACMGRIWNPNDAVSVWAFDIAKAPPIS